MANQVLQFCDRCDSTESHGPNEFICASASIAQVAVVVVAILVAVTTPAHADTFTAGSFVGNLPVSAPGDDTTQVVKVLEAIIAGQDDTALAFDSLYIEGRLSFVAQEWTSGQPLPQNVTLEPLWRTFQLVQRGNKRRFEAEGAQEWAKEISGGKTYRLCDGDAFYSLNPNSLEISGLGNFEGRWSDYIYSFSAFQQVHDGKSFGTVREACARHIERLATDYYTESHRVLECYAEEGLLAVRLGPEPGSELVTESTFWVDPERGFALIKSRLQQGNPGQGRYNVTETTAEYKDVLPGVVYPIRGTCNFSSLGEAAKRDGRAGWGRRDVEITELKVGDFEFDEENFTASSLPIPVGAAVTDFRTSPPLRLNYKQAPLDEQLLRGAANYAPLVEATKLQGRTILIAANVTLLFIVGGLVFLRRFRRRAVVEQ